MEIWYEAFAEFQLSVLRILSCHQFCPKKCECFLVPMQLNGSQQGMLSSSNSDHRAILSPEQELKSFYSLLVLRDFSPVRWACPATKIFGCQTTISDSFKCLRQIVDIRSLASDRSKIKSIVSFSENYTLLKCLILKSGLIKYQSSFVIHLTQFQTTSPQNRNLLDQTV